MAGFFARCGASVDWLFGSVAGAARGVVSAPEFRRVLGVGVASALSGATPFLAAAAASRSRSELGAALYSGFLTGIAGGAVSYLHRRCDGGPYAPPRPRPYDPSDDYGLPPAPAPGPPQPPPRPTPPAGRDAIGPS